MAELVGTLMPTRNVDLFVYIGMISLLDLWLLFQHSIDVDLFHLGWVKCTIGKPES